MELESVHVEQLNRQLQSGRHFHREETLESEVVHREHAARESSTLTLRSEGEIDRGQARMPVVAVDHLRPPAAVEPFGELRGHAAEQSEAQVAVGVGLATGVDVGVALPGVQGRFDQVRGAAVGERAAQELRPARQREGGVDRPCVGDAGTDRREGRQQHAHLAAARRQGSWQRRAHVGKAAGLEERV